jgi:iron complex outermembrane recepter protein
MPSMNSRLTLAAVACAVSLSAQSIADAPPKQLRIPAGELIPALEVLEKQSGIELVFRPDQLKYFHTNGLTGKYDAKDAVRILLTGTPLDLHTEPTGVMVIVSSSSETSLSTQATADGTRASGDGDGSWSRLRLAQAAAEGKQTNASVTSSSIQSSSVPSSELPSSLEEVVVTAQKRAERLQDVPISMSVLGGSALDGPFLRDATEALDTVPGVVATGTNGNAQLSIRGVAAYGTEFQGSNPIGYYLDSVPFGLTRSSIAPDLNPYDLQQIEVLRGPQGTLYGASAEGGLIRVLTNDADLNGFDFKARGSVSGTEDGGANYRGDMAVNVPIIEGKLAVRAVVGDESLSGWIDSPIANHINDEQVHNYRLKVNAQATDDLSIVLSSWNSRDNSGAPSTSGNSGRTESIVEQPSSVDYDAYDFKINYQMPAALLSSMTSYLDYSNKSFKDFAPGEPASDGLLLFTDIPSRVFSQEILLTSRSGSAWRWNVGVFYRDDTDRDTQTLGVLPAPVNFSDSSKSVAAFGELGQRFLNNQLEWTVGLRQFHDQVETQQDTPYPAVGTPLIYQSESFNATTPRAVLSWYPSSALTVYGSYSQGFRSGFPQDFLVTETTPTFPAVKPDKLANYEIGTKGNLWDHRLSFDSALYYMDWRDVQQELAVPFKGTYIEAPINGNSASGVGVDLSASVRPVDGVDVGITFSWNDLHEDSTVYSNGTVLLSKGSSLGEPQYTAGGFMNYTFSFGGSGYTGHFSAAANYNSAFTLPFAVTGAATLLIPSSTILITRASFSVDYAYHWTTTLYVDNANNEGGSYTPPSAPGSDCVGCMRVRPRTAGVQVDYHWK